MSRDFLAVFRLDLAETLRSRWWVFALVLYAALGAIFIFGGMRESTLLGFTGMSRVMLSASHALLLVLPLLALTATVQVVNRARDDGALELLFSLPIRRGAYFSGISAARLLALVVPLVLLFAAFGLMARFTFGQPIAWPLLGRALLIGVAVVVSFTGFGLAVSTFVRNQAKAVTWSLVLWVLAVALLDFALVALLLQWHVRPQVVFALAAINPVEAARIALLAGAEPELSVLGPVGFFASQNLGGAALLALGVTWPLGSGLLAWTLALRRFSRGDVV